MPQRPSTDDERAQIKDGATVFGNWCDGKPLHVCLTIAMSCAMRLAARMGVSIEELQAYVDRHYTDAVRSRQLQQAIGPHTSTTLDGERRIILPMEDPL